MAAKQAERAVITNLTPDAAQRLLAHNTFNRPLRDKRVRFLAKVIREKRWRFNGASIVVDNKGRLLDGQHRCHAVIRANKSIQTVLVTGVSPKVFDTIDQGAKRGFADIFHLCGVTNPSVVGSSLSVIYQSKHGTPEGTESAATLPDMNERTTLFDSLPGYEELVRDVCRYKTGLSGVFPVPMMAGMYFLFHERHHGAAQQFLAMFGTDDEGADTNPAKVVRAIFEDLATKDYRIGRQAKCAYLKLAWNEFVAGKHVHELILPETLSIPINKLTNNFWLEN